MRTPNIKQRWLIDLEEIADYWIDFANDLIKVWADKTE